MILEYPKKSRSVKRKIFLTRTEKLMQGLVDGIATKLGWALSAEEKKVLVNELVADIYRKSDQKSTIF